MKAPRRVGVVCIAFITLTVITSSHGWAAAAGPACNAKANPKAQTVAEGSVVDIKGEPGQGQRAVSYLWAQTGLPQATFDRTAGRLIFNAPQVGPGGATLTFTVTVTCEGGEQATASADVTVTIVNSPPTAVIAVASPVNEGTTVFLDGSGSSDPDGQTLTYAWTQLAGPSVTLANANQDIASFTAPLVDLSGTSVTFRLTVSDGPLSATRDVIISVENVNHAPTVQASCPSSATEGSPVTLLANAADQDGDQLTYSWTQTNGGPPASPDTWSIATLGFTAPTLARGQDGLLRFNVVASDGFTAADASCDVQILDVSKPELHLPSDITAEATSSAGAVVALEATADDFHDGSRDVTCDPVSGATFALGTTSVHCEAVDEAGNRAEGSFNVTVVDTTEPELIIPLNLTIEATGPSGAVATFSASATDLVDGEVTVTCTPESGTLFALGNTNVSCEATDAHNNRKSGSFQVKVQDTTPPALTLPSNIAVEATGPNGAVASYSASATDLVDGSVSVTCTPASDSTFTLGTTTVNCDATDQAGNKGTGSFTVNVVDTTPPSVTVPADMTVEATGPSGAVASFATTASDIVDGILAVTCLPAAGATFALGTTGVSCTATDKSGNSGTGTFNVTVRDTTPPSLNIPVDITLEATGPAGATASFTATATDLVDTNVTVSCVPPSGSTFPLGTTTVTCTGVDDYGNSASRTFTMDVRDTTKPTITPHANEVKVVGTVAPYYTAPTATDIVDGTVTVSCTPGPGGDFHLGANTVECTATDAHGNAANLVFTVTIEFASPGLCLAGPGHQVLQPIALTGRSVFRQSGSTVPVKFRVCDVNGGSYHATYPVARFELVGINGGTPEPDVNTVITSTSADNAFRWSDADQFWIFNLSTKGYPGGYTYQFVITLVDGSTIPVQFGLK